MKLLHIGGALDGLRKNTPDISFFRVATYNPQYYYNTGDPMVPSFAVNTAMYTKIRCYRADGTYIEVAVCTDKMKTDVVDLLVKGYRGHRNPRRKKSWSHMCSTP